MSFKLSSSLCAVLLIAFATAIGAQIALAGATSSYNPNARPRAGPTRPAIALLPKTFADPEAIDKPRNVS